MSDNPDGPGSPGTHVTLVAEVGSNHNRDLDLALRLIDMTAEAGWDAVKFQLFRAAWLYPPTCGEVETPMGLVDFYEVLDEAETPWEWLPRLKERAHERGLQFICSPFDEAAADALEDAGIDVFKVASPELNHLPLLRRIASYGRPVVASTGISTLSDIEEALATLREVAPSADISLLQCTSSYPTPFEDCNLAVVDTMRRAFGVPVGFSDHTVANESVPAIATAIGVSMIEKHVTLDRTLPGPDHPFALELEDMCAMAAIVREFESLPPDGRLPEARRRFGAEHVASVLGHGRKEIMPSESVLYPCDKRSIHAIRDIAAGDPISEDNVRILRSERNLTPGLHPRHWETVLGSIATAAVPSGDGVLWKHLLTRTT